MNIIKVKDSPTGVSVIVKTKDSSIIKEISLILFVIEL